MVESTAVVSKARGSGLVLGSFLLGGLVVSAATMYVRERSRTPAPLADTRAISSKPSSHGDALPAKPRRPFSAIAVASARPASPDPDPVDATSRPAGDEEQVGATMDDYRAFYQILFDEEKVDFAWARDSSNLIFGKINEMCGPGNRLVKSECKTTICRVEIASDSDAAYNSFADRFRGSMFWSGPGIFARRDPSSTTDYASVMYLIRAGTPLRDPLSP